MKIEILPAAQADLIDIGDYIALDNPDRALSFVTQIEAVIFKQIAVRPSCFPLRADLAVDLRVAPSALPYLFHADARCDTHRSCTAWRT